jgi:hypothetical protein
VWYRHRGHRYITLRCFDAAIADLEQASKLIKGKPGEIEPDGLPNAPPRQNTDYTDQSRRLIRIRSV